MRVAVPRLLPQIVQQGSILQLISIYVIIIDMTERSVYQRYEDDTRVYYGADTNPLRFVPFVRKPEVAYDIAHQVESSVQARTEPLTQHDIRMLTVNAEMLHARLAPGDFNEDSEQALAYKMGLGIIIDPRPSDPNAE